MLGVTKDVISITKLYFYVSRYNLHDWVWFNLIELRISKQGHQNANEKITGMRYKAENT